MNTTNTTLNLIAPVETCLPPFYHSPSSGCILCTNASKCGLAELNPVTGLCVQFGCKSNDPCTVPMCDETNGVCYSTPMSYNPLNTSTQFVCNNSLTVQYYTPNSGAVILDNCSDGDPSTIDSYNNNTQRCEHISLFLDPEPTLNISGCLASPYTPPNSSTVNTLGIVDNYYVCQNRSEYCVDGVCVPMGYAEGLPCFYQAAVKNAAGGFTYQQVKDDSRCITSIDPLPGIIYGSCMPDQCPHTLTGCARCQPVQKFEYVVYLSITSCQCCLACSDSNCADSLWCEAGYYCGQPFLGQLTGVLAQCLPLPTCQSQVDCPGFRQCNSTTHRCEQSVLACNAQDPDAGWCLEHQWCQSLHRNCTIPSPTCTAGQCQPLPGCVSNSNCPSGRLCDTSTRLCVQTS